MAKPGDIIPTKIDRWDGGITSDLRGSAENTAAAITNFDIITNPHKMTSYRNSENGDTDASTSQKRIFDIGFWNVTNTWRLFALGVVSGSTKASIHMKLLTTGGSTDLDDSGWTDPANNVSATNGVSQNFFKYYHRTKKFYGAQAGNAIWSFVPDGATAFNEAEFPVSYTNIAQGLVHSKDDILYVPIDNKIYRNNNGAWELALTLPEHFYITSICEFGNDLGIAMTHLGTSSGVGESRVFIWDRDVSVTILSETIGWGDGQLQILDVVDGLLLGISLVGNTTTQFIDRIAFRYLAGNDQFGYRAEDLFTLQASSTASTTQLPIGKQIRDGRLHFMMMIELAGAQRDGVWSIGRSNGQWVLAHERTPNNDTALSGGVLHGFFYVGDYLFQTFTTSAAVTTMKTNDANAYASSIWESKIFNAGDSSLKKDLVGVSVTTEPLASGEQVVVAYRTDANIHSGAAYTTLLTHDTDNAIADSAINIESSGANLPTDYNEIQFQLTASGGSGATGTEITGFLFRERITGKRPF